MLWTYYCASGPLVLKPTRTCFDGQVEPAAQRLRRTHVVGGVVAADGAKHALSRLLVRSDALLPRGRVRHGANVGHVFLP